MHAEAEPYSVLEITSVGKW